MKQVDSAGTEEGACKIAGIAIPGMRMQLYFSQSERLFLLIETIVP